MKLEDLPKYYSPKSPGPTDASVSASRDTLSATDVMAAQGMTRNRAEVGFSALLGKMGASMNDRARAAELLADYALSWYDHVAALRKLLTEIKLVVVRIMASYTFEDYTRSTASKKQCPRCHGKKFIESEVFTNEIQYPDDKPPVWAECTKDMYPSYWKEWKKVREVVKVAYPECGEKGEVSTACKDYHGHGAAIRRGESVGHGMPVIRDCQRHGGRGCEGSPSAEAFNAICKVTSAITFDTWKRSVRHSCDTLVIRFGIEEA